MTTRGNRGWVLVGLVGAVVAALVARTPWLSERGLEVDEAHAWRTIATLDTDSSPRFLVVQKWWAVAVGTTPAALRSLSVVSGLACAVGVFLFARALLTGPLARRGVTGREVAWAPVLAAWFVALNPMLVRYGADARMYSTGAALAVFAGWALVSAVDPTRPRWGWWVLFAVLAAAVANTHPFALLTVAVMAAVVGWWVLESTGGSVGDAVRHPSFAPALGAFVLVAAATAPWGPVQLAHLVTDGADGGPAPLASYKDALVVSFRLVVDPERSPGEFGPARVGVALAAVLLASAWRGRWADGVLLALGVGPAAAAALAGVRSFEARYLVFSLPFLLVVAAVAVARVRRPAAFAFAVVAAVAAHGYWCHDFWRTAAVGTNPGYRGAADHIRGGDPDDVVICGDEGTYLPTRYYLRDRANGVAVCTEVGPTGVDAAKFVVLPDVGVRRGQRVWVVTESVGDVVRDSVPVPVCWVEVSRRTFAGCFGKEAVVVVEYTVEGRAAR